VPIENEKVVSPVILHPPSAWPRADAVLQVLKPMKLQQVSYLSLEEPQPEMHQRYGGRMGFLVKANP